MKEAVCAACVVAAATLTRLVTHNKTVRAKVLSKIGLKHLCNRWCLCFTTTERLPARLISSGFGRLCRGEGEGSLV